MKLDHDFLDHLETYGPIARTLSMCLRPTFTAEDEHHTLVWGDWSSIEARKLPWLADNPGSRKVLDIFRTVDADPNAPDIYMIAASHIYGVSPEEINGRILEGKDPKNENNATVQKGAAEAKVWRSGGKVSELALGFGGGVGALQAMATGYGLYFTEDEAQHIVTTWREANMWARRFWTELTDAFMNAFENPGVAYKAGRLTYIHDSSYHGGSTFCIMPCGRVLTYPNLKWKTVERVNRKGETYEQRVVTYRKGYKWGSIWHGVLCLAGDTLVATNTGWKRLDTITTRDRVWDGVEFVSHSGLIAKGDCRTINIDGVDLTPDHEILTAKGWRHASQCEGLDRAEVRMPDSYTAGERRADQKPQTLAGRASHQHAAQFTRGYEKSEQTNGRFRQYSTLSVGARPVYDLTNAGPRSRFVVKSSAGPMIVHNCENPTQGSAASVLRAKLRRMEADLATGASKSFAVRFHTHDEIGGQCGNGDEAFARDYVKSVMDEPLEWTEGLPLVSEISSHWAYTKAVE